MSLCSGSRELLESYGILKPANEGESSNFSFVVDPVFSHWCNYDPVSHASHYFVGTLLIVICIMSITGNLLVVVVFSRYRRLRSPANTLIVNLAVSDMCNGFLHPMAAYSSFMGAWMFGKLGCELYAALCGLFGLVSIVTLTVIAVERFMVISVKPWYRGVLFTQEKAKLAILFIWVYCLVIIVPPFLGWGAFVPEGFLTSCSFDYLSRSATNRSYFIYIFILGFTLPITVISICYAFIIRTILQNEKDMKKNNVKKVYTKPKKRNDYKAAEMVMFVIAMFLLSWTPYSLIAIIGQFGNPVVLTPWVSVLPSLFAKMSTIYNPAIYGLSHRHFRATLRRIFKKQPNRFSVETGTHFCRNSTMNRSKHRCSCLPNYGSDQMESSSASCTGKKLFLGVAVSSNLESRKIIYIKRAQNCVETNCNCPEEKPSCNELSRSVSKRSVVLTLKRTSADSLIRSLLFRSESSIHQKYQTCINKDQIIKIPTSVCFRQNSLTKTTTFDTIPVLTNLAETDPLCCIPVKRTKVESSAYRVGFKYSRLQLTNTNTCKVIKNI
ncbi:rhodopsin-like [Uloborus diversus]|uniref:rhodopsin-like n=1 Tax=Uloborus diversus TaxID=327109 RepID=UPI0024096603|nr:rhodopsin-like [Uloborus diversus]